MDVWYVGAIDGIMSVEATDATPNHRQLGEDVFAQRVTALKERYADCDLCAYECHVDRTTGRRGTCQVDDTVYVSSYFPHFGEEECLKRAHGSGTIFLAHCNMK